MEEKKLEGNKTEKTKRNDFIELDFVARVRDGEVFDTTIKEEAKKANLTGEGAKEEKKEEKEEKKKEEKRFKPLRICIGQGMVVKGLDKALENRSLREWHEVELAPKEAFGKRNPSLVRVVSTSSFKEPPIVGMFVDANGLLAKVISVSGGRAMIDMNNPLADKVIVYKFRINKIITEPVEKVKVLAPEASEKEGKIFVKIEDKNEKKAEQLKKKVKELIGIEIEIKKR